MRWPGTYGDKAALRDSHAWATEVMTIISNAPGVRLGVWSEIDRDIILCALREHWAHPTDRLELIVDGGAANWRLKAPIGGAPGVRLADYRMSRIGQPEDPAVAAVNDALARLGDGRR